MGLALYVQGYEKVESCISGKIETVGWYEVDIPKIESHRIDGSSMVIHGNVNSIIYIMSSKEPHEYGFYDLGVFTFYYNIMNNISGDGYRKTEESLYGVMFDAKRILNVVKALLQSLRDMKLDDDVKIKEKQTLDKLADILLIISDRNGIVGFVLG